MRTVDLRNFLKASAVVAVGLGTAHARGVGNLVAGEGRIRGWDNSHASHRGSCTPGTCLRRERKVASAAARGERYGQRQSNGAAGALV